MPEVAQPVSGDTHTSLIPGALAPSTLLSMQQQRVSLSLNPKSYRALQEPVSSGYCLSKLISYLSLLAPTCLPSLPEDSDPFPALGFA